MSASSIVVGISLVMAGVSTIAWARSDKKFKLLKRRHIITMRELEATNRMLADTADKQSKATLKLAKADETVTRLYSLVQSGDTSNAVKKLETVKNILDKLMESKRPAGAAAAASNRRSEEETKALLRNAQQK